MTQLTTWTALTLCIALTACTTTDKFSFIRVAQTTDPNTGRLLIPPEAPVLSDGLALNYASSVASVLRCKFNGTRIANEVASTVQVTLAGAGLTSVVAGTVEGNPFNVVTFVFEPNSLPPVTLQRVTAPIETDEQQTVVEQEFITAGLTPLFFAPVFDVNQQINIAACRAGAVNGILLPGTPLGAIPLPNVTPGAAQTGSHLFSTDSSHGSFRGSSSHTTGLGGTETSFSDGTIVIDAQETLSAVRGAKNFGSKAVSHRRVKQGNIQVVQQAHYGWLERVLPDAILVENFDGFPSDVQVVMGKATQFGKKDPEDEGTGSELMKVVQTNSEVFGVSLKKSRLVATFGAPLGNSAQLLNAFVEVFNPQSRRLARVPIVDVGPAEPLSAQIDLTLSLDQFLKTNGSAEVSFRIVV